MKLESVIKKIQKRMPGVEIESAGGRKYWFTYKGRSQVSTRVNTAEHQISTSGAQMIIPTW